MWEHLPSLKKNAKSNGLNYLGWHVWSFLKFIKYKKCFILGEVLLINKHAGQSTIGKAIPGKFPVHLKQLSYNVHTNRQ